MSDTALRLAKEGMELHETNAPEYIVCAEFLRLHALNAELVEALREVLELWQDAPVYGHATADKAWELLVKVEASK